MEGGGVSHHRPGLALLLFGTACRACRRLETVQRAQRRVARQKGRRWLGTTTTTMMGRNGGSSRSSDSVAGVDELTRRPAKFIPDYLVPMPSHLLTTTLSDLLAPSTAETAPSSSKASSSSSSPPWRPPTTTAAVQQHPPRPLPQGHHLVYFPIQTAPSLLARGDGADPDHVPPPPDGGATPFARRMWAGGEVLFAPGWRRRLLLDGRAWACEERVESVDVKGPPGAEKVFVDVWRRYGVGHHRSGGGGGGGGAQQQQQEEEAEGEGAAAGERAWDIQERRTLVFMRNDEGKTAAATAATPRRPIKFPHPATYAVSLTPTPTHLFHFSALTFNAHAIHLDPGYARHTDGHRGLLVHGPLSLALMLRVLAEQTGGSGGGGGDIRGSGDGAGADDAIGNVRRIAYRNYAPLYADEPMTVCVRRPAAAGPGSSSSSSSWDVWVEGPDGGLAVKGTAEMETMD
ncbi:hypothetical protein JDV02_007331 [Purpureocillium takamizusanense]|uniref:Mesaconyl-C4 CoA hydratase n=1 Tax=Purpureocillium takamizusanense TaxID=2060973 RepID=A0A9Q8VE10_9HYPO|nr:uncharacterized protein JDV02_007331 [Purpureocillium takamizusanense]UNI21332.1 hypothetical protein JDV02_007331 [Purpureocillium takamizusanense]